MWRAAGDDSRADAAVARRAQARQAAPRRMTFPMRVHPCHYAEAVAQSRATEIIRLWHLSDLANPVIQTLCFRRNRTVKLANEQEALRVTSTTNRLCNRNRRLHGGSLSGHDRPGVRANHGVRRASRSIGAGQAAGAAATVKLAEPASAGNDCYDANGYNGAVGFWRCTGTSVSSPMVWSTCNQGNYNAGTYYNVYWWLNQCNTRVWLHEYTYPYDVNNGWACVLPLALTGARQG